MLPLPLKIIIDVSSPVNGNHCFFNIWFIREINGGTLCNRLLDGNMYHLLCRCWGLRTTNNSKNLWFESYEYTSVICHDPGYHRMCNSVRAIAKCWQSIGCLYSFNWLLLLSGFEGKVHTLHAHGRVSSFLLILKIMAESTERISIGDWVDHVDFWNFSGVLQCLPIFSMALSCQMLVCTFLLTKHNSNIEEIFSTGNCSKSLKMFRTFRSTKWTST